jgi:hypothetical protein
MLPGGFAP